MKKIVIFLFITIILMIRFATGINYISIQSDRNYQLEISVYESRAEILKVNGRAPVQKIYGKIDYLSDGYYKGSFQVNSVKYYDYYTFIDFDANSIVRIEDNFLKKYYKKTSERFLENMTPSLKNMVNAVIIGDMHIYKDKQEQIRYVGISHMFAMSGLHIGLVFAIFLFIFKKLEISIRQREILTIIIATLYLFSVKISPSLTRAYLMATIVMLSHIIFYKYNVKRALIISAVISLIFKPEWIFSLSFQMSYLAMIAIFYLYPIINKINFKKYKIISYILFSLSIQIMLAPLSVYTFGTLPLWSVITNLILMPIGNIFITLSYLGLLLENFHLGFLVSELLILSYNLFDGAINYFYEYDFLNIAYYNSKILYVYIPLFLFIFLGGILINFDEDSKK